LIVLQPTAVLEQTWRLRQKTMWRRDASPVVAVRRPISCDSSLVEDRLLCHTVHGVRTFFFLYLCLVLLLVNRIGSLRFSVAHESETWKIMASYLQQPRLGSYGWCFDDERTETTDFGQGLAPWSWPKKRQTWMCLQRAATEGGREGGKGAKHVDRLVTRPGKMSPFGRSMMAFREEKEKKVQTSLPWPKCNQILPFGLPEGRGRSGEARTSR